MRVPVAITHAVNGLVPVTEQEARLAEGDGQVAEPYVPGGRVCGAGTSISLKMMLAGAGLGAPEAVSTIRYENVAVRSPAGSVVKGTKLTPPLAATSIVP